MSENIEEIKERLKVVEQENKQLRVILEAVRELQKNFPMWWFENEMDKKLKATLDKRISE